MVLSDNPELKSFIKIEPQLLFSLAQKRGSVQRFLTEIHSRIEAGKTLKELKSELRAEKFRSGLKVVYSEIKSFFSFSASVDTNIG